ncbi:MAG: FAD-dependent monooxygenase [Phycisphaerales bacterium]|nr:FAD-dependent monooxygenase [Phycisphaerales bacterium]
MPDPNHPRFSIVGGGLAGGLFANCLAREGYEVELFERRPDPATGRVPAGRSINLALSMRGITALREVGLADEVLKHAIPMRGRMIHSPTGQTVFQPYSKNPEDAINSVSRAALNRVLIEAARARPNVSLHFDTRCVDVDLAETKARFAHEETGEYISSTGDIVIGADGAFSAVRGAMQRTDPFDYSQSYLAHGYKELTMPPRADGSHAMEPEALHIWPRRSYMMIALPNPDGSFTCTCFWPFDGPHGFSRLKTEADIRGYFDQHFADAVPHMPTLVEDYQRNPVGSLVTVRCAPWHIDGRIALIGDAAHAIVPFYGQGINAGFEDCRVLDGIMREHAPDFRRVFEAYSQERKPHGDAIADLAIANFLEMRDKAGTMRFRNKKRLERTLDALLPQYTPLYTMVTFTNIPYADAVARSERQDRAVAICAGLVLLVLLVVVALLAR